MSEVAAPPRRLALAELIELVKPGISIFAVLTTAGGMTLAPGVVTAALWVPLLLGTALIVGSANTLNMYLERDVDCRMARTKTRPLPAGRLDSRVALVFGLLQATVAVPLLTFAVNPLTGLCAVVAFISYVMLYTPMKQRTTASTLIGSVPGAMPVLMGWTAATGRLDVGGLLLFALMFFWQIPHFHAIALFRRKDYHRAGLKILPVEASEETTRYAIVFYLALQIQVSLLLFPFGVAGKWYLATAVLLGGWYFLYALKGLRSGGPRWAKNLFLISIAYIPLLFTVLVFDGVQ